MRDRYATFLSAALLLSPAVARAAPRTFVELDYGADDACPEAPAFRESVVRQLHYDPFQAGASERVAVQITRRGAGFDGHIVWSDESGQRVGERRLASRDSECSEIAANVAFAVAVQIQLMATLASEDTASSGSTAGSSTGTPAGESASATSPGASSANANAPRPEAPKPPAEPSREGRAGETDARVRVKLSAGVGAALGLGLAPNPVALGRVFAGARLSRFSLELAVDGALPTTFERPDGSGFSLQRFAAGAAACGHLDPVAACATFALGHMEARGTGVDRPTSSGGFFSQLGGRVAATFGFGEHFFVVARGDVAVTLSHVSVKLNDAVVWTTPRVGGILGSDVGVFF